ncbi:DNA repair protein RecO [Lentilactobacillus sp. SPB1-3]|uniref:DNA repair protein RecO n=1 Tax=Lentilactobacillus terminaliae TaxID=3003483 RepID=A0ACD5DCB9_9LACO|nr:DNA repair protein RecO [Lentilactobacillus sp. SPB1-3]MCZ0977274.1 DNA repair protein RecO [Lentilactobacillus sp. SPB1-3]
MIVANIGATDFTGILMYQKAYREHDMLAKFITKQFGKKMFIVRGAKRQNFKNRAAVLPFTYGTFNGVIKEEGLSYFNSGNTVSHYQQISDDIEINAYATYVMSLIDFAFPDSVQIPEWFEKLSLGLALMNDGFDASIITNIFEIQLLEAFGVAPNWVDCVVCHRQDLPFDYSESMGGLLCSNHWDQDEYRLHLDQRTIYYLRLFSVVDFRKLNKIDVNADTKSKLRQVIDQIYTRSVGYVPKSKKFLDQLSNFKL